MTRRMEKNRGYPKIALVQFLRSVRKRYAGVTESARILAMYQIARVG